MIKNPPGLSTKSLENRDRTSYFAMISISDQHQHRRLLGSHFTPVVSMHKDPGWTFQTLFGCKSVPIAWKPPHSTPELFARVWFKYTSMYINICSEHPKQHREVQFWVLTTYINTHDPSASQEVVMGRHRLEWDAVMGMQIESQYQGSATKSEAAVGPWCRQSREEPGPPRAV